MLRKATSLVFFLMMAACATQQSGEQKSPLLSESQRVTQHKMSALEKFFEASKHVHASYVEPVNYQDLYLSATRAMFDAYSLEMPESRYEDTADNFIIFAKIFDSLLRQYPEEDPEQLINIAIKGMLSSLKGNNTLMTQEQYPTKTPEASLGLSVQKIDDAYIILKVFDDSPAQSCGLIEGDNLLTIDKEPIQRFENLQEVIMAFRGKALSSINVEVDRGGNKVALMCKRGHFSLKHVEVLKIDEGTILVKLNSFPVNIADDFKKILHEQFISTENVRTIILDLRANSGGVLNASVDMADLFLGSADVFRLKNRQLTNDYIFRTQESRLFDSSVRYLIFIDKSTAGASEILAKALQENTNATLIGTPSFGLEYIRTVMAISSTDAITLSTGKMFSGKEYDLSLGLVPDICLSEIKEEKCSEKFFQNEQIIDLFKIPFQKTNLENLSEKDFNLLH